MMALSQPDRSLDASRNPPSQAKTAALPHYLKAEKLSRAFSTAISE
jgi:hypothetical protein